MAARPAEPNRQDPAPDPVDEALEESFPASDPPAWAGNGSPQTAIPFADADADQAPGRAEAGARWRGPHDRPTEETKP